MYEDRGRLKVTGKKKKRKQGIAFFKPGREGTLAFYLHWYPKFCDHYIVFVGSKTLDALNKHWPVSSKIVVSKHFNL